MATRIEILALLALASALGGCDPRDCALGISSADCYPQGSALARYPQDDAICRDYGLTPGTHDYAVCRQDKRHVRVLTERETDYGVLKNALVPDVTVVAPVQAPAR